MNAQRRFAVIGVGGYVAPRHLRAIKETGGQLVVALDPNDSVGVMDGFFPDARFFTEFERFDRHVDLLRRQGNGVEFVSICSPNYLHDSHVRFALRSGADAICEKPLVLNPRNIDALQTLQDETGRKINTILQLRLHPTIIALRERVLSGPRDKVYDVDLTYVTPRGRWYHVSWKGDVGKSGGIATNIGVHFYDMLSFVFGDLKENIVHHRADDCAGGYLEYERARVRWFLSINANDLPGPGRSSFRSVLVDGTEVEFSDGFTDLHTASYSEILAGRGFPLSDVRPSIQTVAEIRGAPIHLDDDRRHPRVSHVMARRGN